MSIAFTPATVKQNASGLVRYEAACRAIAEAKSVDEVKDVRNQAEAMRAYAKQAENKQLETDAAEIRIRATRRIGELMAAQRDAGNLSTGGEYGRLKGKGGVEKTPPINAPVTLSEAGIDKNLAKEARRLAAIPEPEFDGIVQDWRERIEVEQARVSVNLLNAGKKAERERVIDAQREAINSGSAQLPEGQFEVVVMDPPWNYGREYDPETSRVANPYPEMAQDELLAMAPPFADDCVLFLWTTHQFIWDAKELMDQWGFTYKASLVWDKEKIGMGAWLRMQCEFCLVGIRGKPLWKNTTWRDIIREARREHSRKPETFYRMVEEITAGRRLDYFSREARDGWATFGNDTEKF